MQGLKIHSLLRWLTLAPMVFFAACGTKHDDNVASKEHAYIRTQIALANLHLESHDIDQAIFVLEQLSHRIPYEPEVWEALAFSYSAGNKNALAARAFERVAHMSAKYQENALYAAQAYKELGDWHSSARCYRVYLEAFPKDGTTWRALAYAEEMLNHPLPALQAYLKALETTPEKPSVEESIHIGNLFLRTNGAQQAEYWFNQALRMDSQATQAYVGLLTIAHKRGERDLCNKYVEILEAKDPGILKSIELSFIQNHFIHNNRPMITQNQTEETGLASKENNLESAANPSKVSLSSELTISEKKAAPESDTTTGPDEPKEAIAVQPVPTEPVAVNSGETENIPPSEQALLEKNEPYPIEATLLHLHNKLSRIYCQKPSFVLNSPAFYTPSLAQTLPSLEATTQGSTTNSMDEDRPLPLSDPTSLETTQQSIQQEIKQTLAYFQHPVEPVASFNPLHNEDRFKALTSPTQFPEKTYLDWLEMGNNHWAKNDYKAAVQAYKEAIELGPDASLPWFKLSQVFFAQQKFLQAELAIFEALQREPQKLAYRMHFLRIAQKRYSTDAFLGALKKAKNAFPKNPEITLVMARTYEKLVKDRMQAAQAYQEFLQLASQQHPKRHEAEQTLQRLLLRN